MHPSWLASFFHSSPSTPGISSQINSLYRSLSQDLLLGLHKLRHLSACLLFLICLGLLFCFVDSEYTLILDAGLGSSLL